MLHLLLLSRHEHEFAGGRPVQPAPSDTAVAPAAAAPLHPTGMGLRSSLDRRGSRSALGDASGDRPIGLALAAAAAVAFCLLPASDSCAQAQATGPAIAVIQVPETPRPDCHYAAAQYHGVNSEILRAILWNESRFNARAVSKPNDNGSVDVGIGQHNSSHFKKLAEVGVTPPMLLDACVGMYVAAWHLSKSIRQHGNTWFGVGAYHSATPYFNHAYANAVAATLSKWGRIPAGFVPFPDAPRSTGEAIRLRKKSGPAKGQISVPNTSSMAALAE